MAPIMLASSGGNSVVISYLRRVLTERTNQLLAAQAQLTSANATIFDLNQQISTLNQRINDLSTTNTQLQTQLDGANDTIEEKDAYILELEARIRSLLRREFTTAPVVLEYGDLRMDRNARKVYAGTVEVRLTKTECGILEYLLCNPEKVVSQEELMDHVYDRNVNCFSDALRVHMHSLRKKLQAALHYNPILTKIGQGYYLTRE